MATFKFGSGAVTAAKVVTVKDAVVNGTDTAFTVDQPANTCLTGVFVKVTGAVDLDSNGNIGFAIGDLATRNNIFGDTDLFLASGQEIPVGTVYNIPASSLSLQAAAQSSPAASLGFTGTARKLHAFIDNPSVAVSLAGTFEIHFLFTHFA
jgi:hypothetical protein|tara:strand:- start:544 stop:996 length:453 start_codon:yes stop_codon:yes gene_type:complete